MSLACLVCHGVESPSHSFRSYSVSSSDNEGKCSVMASCLSKKISIPQSRGAPRLVRSRAVRRDHVRDWNFDMVELDD
ncbi:hypothetical protein Ancab_038230 [Ancistrocladus abbreviatus]